ncbi:MAG: hypothetical protein IKO47_05605 [Ruminococcus sp.]|nr:hypothetical protein [Ruminococcus sp.]
MDNFAEQLVKKNETSADRNRRLGIAIGGISLTVLLTLMSFIQLNRPALALLGILLAVAAGIGTYFLLQNTYVEYEYTFTNGDLDIAKIIAKKKRTELLSVSVRSFTSFGKYSDDIEESEDMTVIFVTDNIASHEYYADFQNEEYGSARLVFAPGKKMMSNIVKALPGKLRASFDYDGGSGDEEDE